MFYQSLDNAITLDDNSFNRIITAGVWLPRGSKETVIDIKDEIIEDEMPFIKTKEDAEKFAEGKYDEMNKHVKKTEIKGYKSERQVYYNMENEEMVAYNNFPRPNMTTFYMEPHEPDEKFLDHHISRQKAKEKEVLDGVDTLPAGSI